jgi:arsenate reductase
METQTVEPKRPRILFVCVENACRSQMAEALTWRLGLGRIEVWSAGSRPAARIHPGAVAVLREIGMDLSNNRPKSLTEVPDIVYDLVVMLGCGESRPVVRAKRRVDWGIADSRDMTLEELRLIRDHLAARVNSLIVDLGRERGETWASVWMPGCGRMPVRARFAAAF